MHRRGVVLLLGFLFAVVVVGGSGVRTPWTPSEAPIAAPAEAHVGTPRIAFTTPRLRAE